MNTQNIISFITDIIVRNGVDWIITIVITFVSVRFATKKYYYSTRKNSVKPHMEQGLKLVLRNNGVIPANAKSILVRNKGFTLFRGRKYKGNRFFSPLRKTVATVGGNDNTTSPARALYWGVLGLAYILQSVVVYDFNEHKLFVYKADLKPLPTVREPDGYYYKKVDGDKVTISHKLSELESCRNVMYAIPLTDKATQKLVGGITFDVDCDIHEKADDDEKKKFYLNDQTEVIEICRQLNDICSNIITAYFSER